MRIVIDLQGAQSESRFRGIGRYSLSLALAIARNAGEHEVWLALSLAYPESIIDIRHAFEGLIPQEHIRIFKVPFPIEENSPDNIPRARAAELLYEHFLEQLNPDIVLISSIFDEGYFSSSVASVGKYATSYKTAAILYDLIPLLNAEHYLADINLHDYYMRRVESLKKVDLLLSISESSKKEAVEALGIPENRISNISCAVDESFRYAQLQKEELDELYKRYSITRKIVMYAPGGFDKRKNFEGLIEAYSQLPRHLRDEYQLVIVSKIQEGNYHKLKAVAKKSGLSEEELILTGYVPNEDLVALYSNADLFVFPSRHEGFGLPVLEAMACSAPVIGSNTTSIPEVIGLNEALFDPNSINSMTEKIQEALESQAFRDRLREHAKKQVKLFSWDHSAKLALESMDNLFTDSASAKTAKADTIIEAVSKVYATSKPSKGDLEQIAFCLSFNLPNSAPKQLLLDISVMAKADMKSGVQRVVRSILVEMLKNRSETYSVKPIYFDGKHYRYANTFAATLSNQAAKETEDDVVDFRQGDIYLALDITAHLIHILHDFYAYLCGMGVEVYFIVYDILFANNPQWWIESVSVNFNDWLKSIAEVSTGLICISQATADEVREWMDQNPPKRLSPPKVISFHLGADIENSAPSKGVPKNSESILNQLRSKPSFLMVGTIEPRKGHRQTLEAFEKLWRKGADINLVIVGKEGWLVKELVKKLRKHPERNKRIFWLEGISDEYLEKVYTVSACLIAASEGEGFGLPLIEAAQHKLPIIARDLPVFREVAGKYAYYFDNDNDPAVLADAIKNWLDLFEKGRYPKSVEIPYLTWKESTQQLLQLIAEEAEH